MTAQKGTQIVGRAHLRISLLLVSLLCKSGRRNGAGPGVYPAWVLWGPGTSGGSAGWIHR